MCVCVGGGADPGFWSSEEGREQNDWQGLGGVPILPTSSCTKSAGRTRMLTAALCMLSLF